MFVIIGHGLAGALLADALLRRGQDVRVVDRGPVGDVSPASAVASGILNPVTGKRLTRAWNLETFLPAALKTYRALEDAFSTPLVRELDALWLHASAEDAALFATRASQDPELFEDAVSPQPFQDFLHLREAPGRIHPVYGVDVSQTLSLLRDRLRHSGALIESSFDPDGLHTGDDGLHYRDLPASHIIFCEGAAAVANPYFQNLPWSPAAGEALILSIPGLPRTAVYKLGHGLSLAPWPGPIPGPAPLPPEGGIPAGKGDQVEQPGEINNSLQPHLAVAGSPPPRNSPFGGQGGRAGGGAIGAWWLGSNYLWDTLKPAPTATFRHHCESQLRAWLKLPFEIIGHRAGVRPATVDRKPLLGFHPLHPRVGIFNGLGAKGVLMAPYLAENLAAYLTDGTPLMPEADIARHRRALSR